MVEKIHRFIYIFLLKKSAGRSECMGHNTCKSMGLVLCVVRQSYDVTHNV